MRYPPKLPLDAPVQREVLPGPGVTVDRNYAHRDMHGNNVLFADTDLSDPEHRLSLRTKVCSVSCLYDIWVPRNQALMAFH